jgi:hypothetical protein
VRGNDLRTFDFLHKWRDGVRAAGPACREPLGRQGDEAIADAPDVQDERCLAGLVQLAAEAARVRVERAHAGKPTQLLGRC